MKYRNIRSLNNALDAAKPLVLKHPEQLDGNPMLLNTPGGTYDLTKGINGWRATDPADLITKVTAVVPNEEGRQLWRKPCRCSSAATRVSLTMSDDLRTLPDWKGIHRGDDYCLW